MNLKNSNELEVYTNLLSCSISCPHNLNLHKITSYLIQKKRFYFKKRDMSVNYYYLDCF